MANTEIIDTLVQVFKVDPTGVKEGVASIRSDVAKGGKSLEDLGKSAKKTATEVAGITKGFRQLATALQVAAATMGLFKVMNNNIGIGNLSERTGQSTKSILALQRQFQKMGYSAQEANQAIDGFANGLAAAFYKGEGEGLRLPAMFRVDVIDRATGKMRDAVDVMLDIGDAARKMTGDEQSAIMMLQQYGMTAAQAHFAAREASRAEYQAEVARAKLDQPRIDKMREINKVLEEQKNAIDDLASEILVGLNPVIIKTGELLREFVNKDLKNFPDNVKIVGRGLYNEFKPVLDILIKIGEFVDKITTAFDDTKVGKLIRRFFPSFKDLGNGGGGSKIAADKPVSTDEVIGNWQSVVGGRSHGTNTTSSGILNERERRLSEAVHRAESNIKGSNNGYNAYNQRTGKDKYSARIGNLTDKTLGEIMAMQDSKEAFAVGRYQVIPKTLHEAMGALGLSKTDKFDASTQDRIFQYLANKRAGSRNYLQGGSDLRAAQHALSQEWAGIANPHTGRSYYDKIGGNHANISTAQFEAMMREQGSVQTAMLAQSRGHGAAGNVTIRVDNVNIDAKSADAKGVGEVFAYNMDGLSRAHMYNSGADV